MIPGCRIEKLCEIFASAFEQFESLVIQLQDETSANMEHGQVEALIFGEGMELLRRLFQAHLDVRSEREESRPSVLGCDGILRTHCRCGCKRSLMSRFGELIVRRKGYSAPGADSLFPLDRELNLPSGKYSEGLQYLGVRQVASESFDRVVEDIQEETAGKIPKRQLEEITSKTSVDFDAFYSQPMVPEVVSDLLVMSTDGKGIVMREDDLRPATRKAAKEQKHEPGSRLQPGQKPNRKRMATVATVYSIEAQERSAEQIMGQCREQPPRPRAMNKRVWASVDKDSEEVIRAAFEEARRRDPTQKRHWVILVDGLEHQLELIISIADPYAARMTLVLDFIHVLEYLWKAAYSFHPVGSKEAEQWVGERALEILRGNAAAVAAQMSKSATDQKLSENKRNAVDKCAGYLEKYLPIIQYDRFLSQGLPIATGVIEGACRHLVKDRMDVTGARWRLDSAEAVLRIRSLRSSGDLGDYWDFHRKQEHYRNHVSRYDEEALAA